MRKSRYKWLIAIYVVVLVIITTDYYTGAARGNQATPVQNSIANGIVRYTSDAYDAFSGWDWFVDPKTSIGIGVAKDGFLSKYGPKIHPIDMNNPQPWSGGEYFCDPDTMILAKTKSSYNIVYGSYLNWEKDRYLSDDKLLARQSFRFNAAEGLRTNLSPEVTKSVSSPKLDIREDHTLVSGKPWVETTVTITNKYPEPADLLYIYQDAAFMWLPDQNQSKVETLIVNANNTMISNQFESIPTSEKVVVGTYHKEKKVYGGIYTDNPYALTGISSNYLLFNELENDTTIERKFVDSTPRDINETVSLIEEESKKSDGDYKIRFVAFPVMNLEPDKMVTLRFYRIAFQDENIKDQKQIAQKILQNIPK
ncbi:hypothetical protein [Bacillus sp. 3255]|uniref:hypothetical protein n=1 Tax=Bacillus sp. 3255 TaxID=2817904 RepID=UPI00285DFF7C|nr:hypothetical protein [Bacillus sp. 3255]MDR6878740.1 hypothetical protein [Bacillus sp. 3255]